MGRHQARKTAFFLSVVFILSACANQHKAYSDGIDKILVALQKADYECSIDPVAKTNELENIRCTKGKVLAAAKEANFQDIELLESHYSLNEKMAEGLTKGELEPAQYNKFKENLTKQTVGLIFNHLEVIRAEDMERQQRAAAIGAALSQGMNSMSNAYNNSANIYGNAIMQKPWTTTNCRNVGGSVNCYSY